VSNDDWNRTAVEGLLADAERVLALTEFKDVRGNEEIVEITIASARQNYIDLVRRSRPLIMSHDEQTTLQGALDRLKERLRFFGDAT
jgi:hypothetical protein